MTVATRSRDPFRGSYYIPVAGGRLHVARAGPPPREASTVVVGVHGITGSHVAWRPVARVLADHPDVCLLAPDLRGRGVSARLPLHGFRDHVDDVVAVLDQLGIERALLAGHSMGAYVVARVASEHPRLASGVVLVDGGLPLTVPEHPNPDQMLEEATRTAAERVCAPLHLLRAPRGLLDDDHVMVPDAALQRFLARRPDATAELVEDTDHYSILTGGGAPRVAAALARERLAA
jgi:pimeloyl-ACP methyl ester carboxylesterase